MDFLAVLDYEHLDNGMFLTSFARALSKKKIRGLIIHGDSEYTERIIQTGVMREDARVRAIKELNHRLIALFADEGVSTIGINGFQKSLATTDGDHIHIDKSKLAHVSVQPMLLLSNLGLHSETGNKTVIPLPDYAEALKKVFDIPEIVLFSKDESADIIKQDLPSNINIHQLDNSVREKHIPDNFKNSNFEVRITTPGNF